MAWSALEQGIPLEPVPHTSPVLLSWFVALPSRGPWPAGEHHFPPQGSAELIPALWKGWMCS